MKDAGEEGRKRVEDSRVRGCDRNDGGKGEEVEEGEEGEEREESRGLWKAGAVCNVIRNSVLDARFSCRGFRDGEHPVLAEADPALCRRWLWKREDGEASLSGCRAAIIYASTTRQVRTAKSGDKGAEP